MKKSTFFVLGLSFTLVNWGCNVAGPLDHNTQPIAQQINANEPQEVAGTLLRLPKPLVSPPGSVRVNRLVSPSGTTILSGTLTYATEKWGIATFDVKFTVPGGAVSDTVTVSMTIDSSLAKIEFKPDGLHFLKPASLDVSLINFDPFSPREIIRFVYVNSNGTLVPQEFEKLVVSGNKGNIMMKKGKVRHFSAYGFGRLTSEENGM